MGRISHRRLERFDARCRLRSRLGSLDRQLASESENGYTPLMLAALDGSVENFRMLFFSAKVDVHRRNRFGHSAFYYACCRGKSLEMVDLMLERLASVGNKTALIELGTQVDANVNPTCVPLESVKTHVRQTLSFGSANAEQIPAWLRPSSGSPLEQLKDAISERNRKRFDDLLCLRESRVIANLADENGMIPLIWAAAHEEDDKGNVFYMVRKLLPMTLDPNNRDKWGRTAFYYACTFNNVNLVQRLYADPPVDIELADIFGNKPSEAQMQHMWFADATTTKLVQKEIDRRATKKKAEMERKEGEAARNEPREDDESPEQSPRKRRRMSEASDDSVIVLHKNLEDRSATDVEQDEQMEDSELGNGVEDRSLFDQAESSDVIGLNSEMQLQKHDVDPGSCALTPSRPASPVIEHPEPTTVPDKLTAESGQEMSTGALDPVSAPEAEHPPPVPKPKPWRCTVPGCSKVRLCDAKLICRLAVLNVLFLNPLLIPRPIPRNDTEILTNGLTNRKRSGLFNAKIAGNDSLNGKE